MNSQNKRIVFLQAGRLGGLQAQILGAGQSVQPGETVTLVADGLVVKFRARANVVGLFQGVEPNSEFEVDPTKSKNLTAISSIERFGHMLQGEGAVFDSYCIPLLQKFCPCCG